MLRRYRGLTILVASIMVAFAGCSSDVKLPESLLGVWKEEMNKITWPDPPRFEKSSSPMSLKFEQQGKKAVVFISEYMTPDAWSQPFLMSESGNNSWSFKYRGRTVSLKLDGNKQLQVIGLSMRSYNQALVKRDPEPVEAIFVKKS